jgi:hypothetical protein
MCIRLYPLKFVQYLSHFFQEIHSLIEIVVNDDQDPPFAVETMVIVRFEIPADRCISKVRA